MRQLLTYLVLAILALSGPVFADTPNRSIEDILDDFFGSDDDASVQPPTAPGGSQAMSGWLESIKEVVSGLGIDTRQHSLSTEQGVTVNTGAQQALANAIVETEQQIALRDAVARYESMHADAMTGLCATAAQERMAGQADSSSENVAAAFEDHERRWLEEGGSRVDVLTRTHYMRRTAFCTPAERERVLCDPAAQNVYGVHPAGDGNAGPWLLRREYGSAEVDTGSVFMDTVAPFPTIDTAEGAASGSVQDILDRAEARRELALVALSRAALSDVLIRGMEGGLEE